MALGGSIFFNQKFLTILQVFINIFINKAMDLIDSFKKKSILLGFLNDNNGYDA